MVNFLDRDLQILWADGACRDSKDDLYAIVAEPNPTHAYVRAAKALCATCPVQALCLEYANEHEGTKQEDKYGMWGGLTTGERARLTDGKNDSTPRKGYKSINEGPCTIPGCSKKAQRRRLCHEHLSRHYKYGDALGVPTPGVPWVSKYGRKIA